MSDKNMDDLLAQLQSEFAPKQPKSGAQKSSAPKSSQPPQSSKPDPSMEQMLAELRRDLESGRGRPNSASKNSAPASSPAQAKVENKTQPDKIAAARKRELLNALIDTDYRRQAHKREQMLAEIQRQKEAKLAEIKRQEAAKLAAQQQHERDLLEVRKTAELRERKRKEALRESAKEWLKNLNPRSEEGKWFQEFSYSYEDKLKAAIDYLDAMRESGL